MAAAVRQAREVEVSRRALVTGGAGFIGSHIVRRLVDLQYDVDVIDDLSSGDRARVESATLHVGDVAAADVTSYIEDIGPDLVVHAAAQTSVIRSHADPASDRAVNLHGTVNVLEGAAAAGCRRFVFLSSGGAIYGATELASESTAAAPESPYGRHKLAAELEVAASGIPFANLRLANVYGPGQRSDLEGGVVAIFAEQLTIGRPMAAASRRVISSTSRT